jgi:hypothetical protein
VLRLLLDAHLSPEVASQLTNHRPEMEAAALRDWQGGTYREAPDDEVLAAAAASGWTLVTYDRRTITPLLVAWAETGISHGGVILVDERTLASNDVGGLVRALLRLWDTQQSLDWTDRTQHLAR